MSRYIADLKVDNCLYFQQEFNPFFSATLSNYLAIAPLLAQSLQTSISQIGKSESTPIRNRACCGNID
ncbi:MAG: hypothetical protein RM338_03735 [Nostoc sp. DedQUE12a]|nr:hypothetical protein [Nostoc sp. DedQUE12a]